MDVTVLQTDLVRELALSRGFAGSEKPIPIYADVRLRANGKMFIDATNGEHWLHTSCPATIAKAGSSLAPAKLLARITSLTTAGDIRLKVDKKGRLLFTAADYEAQLQALPVADFPKPPERDTDRPSVTVPSAVLRQFFQATAFTIDDSDTMTSNAVVEWTAALARVVCTNGSLLAVVTSDPIGAITDPDEPLLLGKRAVNAILAVTDGDDPVSIHRTQTHVFFDVGHRTLIVRPSLGKPPAFKKILSAKLQEVLTTEREPWLAAVRRLQAFAPGARDPLTIDAEPGTLRLSLEREATELVPVTYDGPAFSVKLNLGFVAQALEHADTSVVFLRATGDNMPVKFTSGNAAATYGCLIAQVRITEDTWHDARSR